MTYPAAGVGDFIPATAAMASDVVLFSESLQVIPANSSVTYGPFPVTSPAYAVLADALVNASATIGLIKVSVSWTDAATSLPVGAQDWYILGTQTSPALANTYTTGRGPTEANQVTVTVTNYDPSFSATIDLTFWQSSRLVTRHDWRGSLANGANPEFNLPSSYLPGGVLAWNTAQTVTASSAANRFIPLYAGQVMLIFGTSSFANVAVGITAPMPDYTPSNQPAVWNGNLSEANTQLYLTLPRCPCKMTITNTGSGSAVCNWSLFYQEFAS